MQNGTPSYKNVVMLKTIEVKGSELLPGDIVIIALGDPKSIKFFDMIIGKGNKQFTTENIVCWKFLFSSGKIREKLTGKDDLHEVWRCT
jgi:hypothetical protein